MLNTDQKQAVTNHLDELLVSPEFVRSKRIASFLRFIVSQTLDKVDEVLKERTIGIAVYDRPLDWDPKVDTIVRTEARRLRKKLTTYYSSAIGADKSVRIEVPTGSYVPVFRFISEAGPAVSVAPLNHDSSAAPIEMGGSDHEYLTAIGRQHPPLFRLALFSAFVLLCLLPPVFFLSNRSRISANVQRFEIVPFTWEYGREFSPAISPDERQIAYVWDKDDGPSWIYLKSVQDGNPQRLTQSSLPELSPCWSPTGKEIAFLRVRSKQTDVIVRRMSDGMERTVGSIATQLGNWTGGPSPLVGDLGPAWTPDGSSLILMDRVPHVPVSGLYQITLSDGSRRQLTRTQGSGTDLLPRVSRDGRMLAFVRTMTHGVGDIYLLDLKTLELRKLTDEGYSINGLAWSDNPDQLIFSSNRKSASQLWTLQISDGSIRKLETDSTTALDPQIAPRGDWIAYVTTNQGWDIDRIRIDEGITSEPERFIASSGRNHGGRYSPDGSHMAFVSDRSGSWEIWLCDAACDNPVKLTNFQGAWIGGLSWSPDSKQLAFDARLGGHSAICRMAIAHPFPKIVEKNNFEERMPSWSADGKFLYFNSDRDGTVSIWKRNLVTGVVQKVTDQASFYEAYEQNHLGTVLLGRLDGTLWRMQIGAPNSAKVLTGVTVDPVLGWTTHAGAAYYCKREDADWIRILEYSSSGTRLVARVRARLPQSTESLDVSPDGRFLLLSVIDHSASNIYLRRNTIARLSR